MKELYPVFIIFVTGAMADDAAEGKVRNLWILPAFLSGVGWRAWRQGMFPALAALAGAALTLMLLEPLRRCGGLGGGGCKLLAALSVFFSYSEFVRCAAAAFLAGGGAAVWMLAAELRACRRENLRYGRLLFHALGRWRRRGMPFALPVGAAFLAHIGGVF